MNDELMLLYFCGL